MFTSRFPRLVAIFLALSLLLVCATAHIELSKAELAEYHNNMKHDSEALSRCLESPEI